ncbi:hypothetical protein CHS0354_037688 [Potamilus streckersoni]|uniref:BPTI/Kunitz inhibitor domain-containing protein n=1 Tax=Potamilus streckersoni TaxID=2493646 RepID=A0AAE0T1A1_9BIVA|nr:hypothetical protein CHS0354_037688 [Potamilus streckersoni]
MEGLGGMVDGFYVVREPYLEITKKPDFSEKAAGMQWKRHFVVFMLLHALLVNNFAEGQQSRKKKKERSKSKVLTGPTTPTVLFTLPFPKDDQQDVCQLPSEVGPCKARIKRYYFKKESGKCRSFHYGGCGGNENNFTSRSSCRKRCEGKGAKNDWTSKANVNVSMGM